LLDEIGDRECFVYVGLLFPFLQMAAVFFTITGHGLLKMFFQSHVFLRRL